MLCAAARSGALWVREAASAVRGRRRRPGWAGPGQAEPGGGRAQRQRAADGRRPQHHGVSGGGGPDGERRGEAGGDRGSRPSSRRGGRQGAGVRARLRGGRFPLPSPPPSALGAGARPVRWPGRRRSAGSEPAPAEGRPEQGERRGHGGKRSLPPTSPLPLPAPGRSSGRFPAPFMPGRPRGGQRRRAALCSRLAAQARPAAAPVLPPASPPR